MWPSASIIITSSEISVEEISESLGLVPTRSYAKGTLMSDRNPRSMRRRQHVWILASSEPDSAPMAAQIDSLISTLEPRRDALQRLQAAVSIELRLGWYQDSSQGSFSIDPRQIRLLGEAGASIVVDIYRE